MWNWLGRILESTDAKAARLRAQVADFEETLSRSLRESTAAEFQPFSAAVRDLPLLKQLGPASIPTLVGFLDLTTERPVAGEASTQDWFVDRCRVEHAPEVCVRLQAVRALGELGVEVEPDVLELLDIDEQARTIGWRDAASDAILRRARAAHRRLGAPSLLTALLARLTPVFFPDKAERERQARRSVDQVLGEVRERERLYDLLPCAGPMARLAVPLLRTLYQAETRTELVREESDVDSPMVGQVTVEDRGAQERNQQVSGWIHKIGDLDYADLPMVLKAAHEPDPVGRFARKALPTLLSAKGSAFPVLVDAMREPDPVGSDARAAVQQVLAWLATLVKELEETRRTDPRFHLLILVVQSFNQQGVGDHREYAAFLQALGKLGTDAKFAQPVLVELLDHDNPYIRWAAAKTMFQIRHIVKEVRPVLEMMLWDRHADLADRQAAAWYLGQMGPAARKAVPLLVDISRREDVPASLRESAKAALKLVDPTVSADAEEGT